MPQFQLEVAILLAATAACSLFLFYLRRSKDGQIKLPVHAEDDGGYQPAPAVDPFDVLKPEDLVDGSPIDEEKFWATVGVKCVKLSTTY